MTCKSPALELHVLLPSSTDILSRVPGGGGYGQNLAMWASSGDAKALGENMAISQSITDMWHNGEARAYPAQDYGKATPDQSNFEAWGHFSQLVWVNTKQVGCHSQYCEPGTMYPNMGAWFTVCNYFPAGKFSALHHDLAAFIY